jgi:hypothetical protein
MNLTTLGETESMKYPAYLSRFIEAKWASVTKSAPF